MSTDERPPILFTSVALEQDIRGICSVHAIPFEIIADLVHRDYLLLPAGSTAGRQLEIGKKRLLENPSLNLEDAIYAYLRGFTLAQESIGHGKRLQTPSPALGNRISEMLARERAQRFLNNAELLASSPDRELSGSHTMK